LEERSGDAGHYHAARGLAVLSVGLRGCSGSGGEFNGIIPGSPSGDGYDTIEWAATQPWCSGEVGMICGSISGMTAYQTATEAPPHLIPLFVREGAVSILAPSSQCRQLIGMQMLAVAWTENRLDDYLPEQRSRAQHLLDTWNREWQEARQRLGLASPLMPVPEMVKQLPLAPHPLFTGVADYYNDLVHDTGAAGADAGVNLSAQAHQVRQPIYHLGGWYDGLLVGNLAIFTALRQRAATAEARAGQRLIVGPWVHGPRQTDGSTVGLLEFGPNASLDFLAFRQRWYDAQLNGQETLDDPAVWLYLAGADHWLGFESWPPPIDETKWYLNGEQLATTPPSDAQEADAYDYDPRDPVPSLMGGGAMGIGLDQRPIEDRLLTYTSPPLDGPLVLLGPLKCILYASSSAPDTDWIVRLTMVRPDGASVILSGGTMQARYRRTPTEAVPLEPDRPERFEIEMLPVSMVVPAAHALRLTVTSSDFPLFARNLNTFDPNGKEREGQVATNRIYHDAERPSHIILPVLRAQP
jgi:putative CocE/NonD family hydrolase